MSEITVKSVIETAIKSEELGARTYSELAKKHSDKPEIKEMFELLARDEVEHKRQFSELMAMAPEQGEVDEANISYMEGLDIGKHFGVFDKMLTMSEQDALRSAYDFEKESVLYYVGLKEMIKGDTALIDDIIKMEKYHMTKLMKYIVTESEFRGISDKF